MPAKAGFSRACRYRQRMCLLEEWDFNVPARRAGRYSACRVGRTFSRTCRRRPRTCLLDGEDVIVLAGW